MKTIWKFSVKPHSGIQTVKVNEGAVPVSLMNQSGPQMWVELDPDAPEDHMRFLVVGTGWEIPSDAIYVDSTICGAFVWHLYRTF